MKWTSAMHRSAPQPSGAVLARGLSLPPLAVIGLAFLVGCQSYSSLPEPAEGTYAGPSISAESFTGEHVLVANPPTPGYAFTLDGTREAFRKQQVFVTLRKPNPAVLYKQEPVQLRLATGIPTKTAATVYARVVEYGESDGPSHREALVITGQSAHDAPK